MNSEVYKIIVVAGVEVNCIDEIDEHRNAAHDIIFKNLNRERKGMELIKI